MKKTTLLLVAIIMITAIVPLSATTVKLQNGTTFKDAILVRLTPASFILQADGVLYELTSDEISPVSLQGLDFSHTRAPLVTHHYDEIHPDGTVTMYSSRPVTNNGRTAITATNWGLAPWERNYAERRHYLDSQGITLTPIYNPPIQEWANNPGKRVQLTMPLPVPLAPGESMTITTWETTNWTRKTAEGIVYRSIGDYSEDRLIWRKVRLPLGANIVRVAPQPNARFTHGSHEYLMWRRYYKKGESYPLEVVFTLSDR